jgi:hypothetical protein
MVKQNDQLRLITTLVDGLLEVGLHCSEYTYPGTTGIDMTIQFIRGREYVRPSVF